MTKKGKRGLWHYDFIYRGKRFQGSTGQTNVNKAKLVEAKMRSDVALEAFGIGPQKQAPGLADFLEGAFLQHVDQNSKTKSTEKAYHGRVKRLLQWKPWKDMPLSEITGDVVNNYVKFRKGVSIAGINSELAVLRMALYLAAEWDLCKRRKIKMLPGAKGRDFVVSPALEAEYLEAAAYPLKQVAILMLDIGLRPEECVSLDKSHIDTGAMTILVDVGKSANAHRTLPMTQRAKAVVDLLSALFPDSPFLFPGYRNKHMTPKYLTHLHEELRAEHDWPLEFVLYNFRHTAATRLGDSGANPFELAAFLGHSDIRMVAKYVHSSSENLRLAIKRREALDRMLREEATHDALATEKQPYS